MTCYKSQVIELLSSNTSIEMFKYYIVQYITMKKIVKSTGNSLCIILDAEDVEVYKLKKGDIIDIEIYKTGIKNRNEKKN